MTLLRFSSDRGELGHARLVDGRLVADAPGLQEMIDSRAVALDMNGLQLAEHYASWSNGYVTSELVAEPGEVPPSAHPVTTYGVDLAATAVGTAVVVVEWDAAGARGRLLHDAADGSADTQALLTALATGDKIGIDCPFGWPADFVRAVAAHHERDPWPAGPDVADRRTLRLRETDRHVADDHGKSPLSVSSDWIGSVAMRWAALVTEHERVHGPIDRTGRGRLVEVYPALALRVWGLEARGYKKDDDPGRAARVDLLERLTDRCPGLALDDDLWAAADHGQHGDDVVDALIAALVAAASATEDGVEDLPDPFSSRGRLAASEGWIAVPGPTSLDTLAPRRRLERP